MNQLNLASLKKWFQDPRNRVLAIAVVAMFLIISAVQIWGPQAKTETEQTDIATADTYIPEGFVLVPIELQNSDSLASLIGGDAVVDLFRGPHSQKVGKRLKLLRAPLNPQQFAVLVPEDQVSTLLSSPGPFWAAIQNPQQTKQTEIASRAKKSRIEYYQGD